MGTNVPAPLISSDASGATDTRKPLAELTVCDVWVCKVRHAHIDHLCMGGGRVGRRDNVYMCVLCLCTYCMLYTGNHPGSQNTVCCQSNLECISFV